MQIMNLQVHILQLLSYWEIFKFLKEKHEWKKKFSQNVTFFTWSGTKAAFSVANESLAKYEKWDPWSWSSL